MSEHAAPVSFYLLKVVCSDKGQHPPKKFLTLAWGTDFSTSGRTNIDEMGLDWAEFVPVRKRGSRVMETDAREVRAGAGWRFNCPSCPRDVPWKESTLAERVLKAVSEGRGVVDISDTP